jgi:hypothetical protein
LQQEFRRRHLRRYNHRQVVVLISRLERVMRAKEKKKEKKKLF